MRKTINMIDKNYERIKTLADEQKTTITQLINMAVDRYIINVTKSDTMIHQVTNKKNNGK